MTVASMKCSSRRSGWYRALLALGVGSAVGCAPPVNIGDLPESSAVSSSAGTSTSGGSSGDPPLGGTACGVVTTVASDLNFPSSLAISGDTLYVVTGDTQNQPGNTGKTFQILKMPLAGGAPVVLTSSQLVPLGIAANATGIYWTEEDKVKSMPVDGGPVTVIATGQDLPWHVVLDATSVYWGNAFDGRVMKAPLGGGAVTTLFDPGPSAGLDSLRQMVVDAENVYWSIADTSDQFSKGSLMKVPIDGGTPTTLASGLVDVEGIAVDATNIYWTELVTFLPDGTQSPGTVWKQRLDGSSGPVKITTQLFPRLLAVEGPSVYWGGGVMDSQNQAAAWPTAVSVDSSVGTGPETILSSVINGAGLIACPGGVCWTDAATGKVMRFVACSP